MPLKVTRAWIDQNGHLVPATDNRKYDIKCSKCGTWRAEGSGRYGGEFLCDECLMEVLRPDEDKP